MQGPAQRPTSPGRLTGPAVAPAAGTGRLASPAVAPMFGTGRLAVPAFAPAAGTGPDPTSAPGNSNGTLPSLEGLVPVVTATQTLGAFSVQAFTTAVQQQV